MKFTSFSPHFAGVISSQAQRELLCVLQGEILCVRADSTPGRKEVASITLLFLMWTVAGMCCKDLYCFVCVLSMHQALVLQTMFAFIVP